jgi:hypothetical protein
MEQDNNINEHIKVFCRIRPELPEDNNSENQFYITGDGSESTSSITQSTNDGKIIYNSANMKKEYEFKVDGIFDQKTQQDKVYDITCKLFPFALLTCDI